VFAQRHQILARSMGLKGVTPRVCPFCGTLAAKNPCGECAQISDAIWTVEPRRWSASRAAAEALLLAACASLYALPLAHLVVALLVFSSAKRETAAHVIVGIVIVIAAIAEASLLFGLMQRVLARWSRRWRFRTASGGGWVRMAAGRALAGYGSIAINAMKFRWMADYTRNQRSALKQPL
jgi:small-conductance mechanosensitive channel